MERMKVEIGRCRPFVQNENIKRQSLCNKLDVLVFDYIDLQENGIPIKKNYNMCDSSVMNGREIANLAFSGGLVNNMGYPVRFLLRRNFLLNNHVSFPEKMKYGEDTVWMARAVLYSERIMSSSICAYYYIHHDSSTCGIMKRSYPGRTIFERCVLVPEQIIQFSNELAIHRDISFQLYSCEIAQFAICHYVNVLPIMFGRMNNKERSCFFELFSKDQHEIIDKANCLTKLMLLPYIGRIISSMFSVFYKAIHSKS